MIRVHDEQRFASFADRNEGSHKDILAEQERASIVSSEARAASREMVDQLEATLRGKGNPGQGNGNG